MSADEETLLRYLDHQPPVVTAAEIAARARKTGDRIRLRWAAGFILVAVLAGTAVAMPGSPVRGWLSSVTARLRGGPAPKAVDFAPAPEEMAGIAIVPGTNFAIEFTRLQENGRLRVTFTDGDQVQVSAPSGAASFSSDPEKVVIDNQGSSADFAIELPRASPRIVIRVAGVRVLLKQGDRVTLSRGTAESGSWILPLTVER
jgi:hypothetical protein